MPLVISRWAVAELPHAIEYLVGYEPIAYDNLSREEQCCGDSSLHRAFGVDGVSSWEIAAPTGAKPARYRARQVRADVTA